MPTDLHKLTACEAVDLLQRRELSPAELIDAAAARIEAVDGAVNALPTLCLDRARAQADRLADVAPLHGLPIAVKDLTDVAGVRTTLGSPIYADRVPESSGVVVEVLEARGANVIAKSNTPEFGAGANTFNEVFGATRNPWDTRKTCGGSSGGAAVALATGQVALATGSDYGGSLRIPASFCGIVGFRPSPGCVAHGPGALPFQTQSVDGPMARNVADVALMLDAMSGPHRRDPISRPAPATSYRAAVAAPTAPKRIAWSPDLGIAPVDPEVRDICAEAAGWFARDGVEVSEACFDLSDARDMFRTLRAVQFASGYASLLESHRDQLKPEVIWNIEAGLNLTGADIARAEAGRGALYHRVCAFFDEYDLLLCPVVLTPPFDVETRYLAEFGGVVFDNYVDWLMMTFALTLTGCPSLSLPCGFTGDGLPVGLQILGPPHGEAEILSAAALYEAAHDFAARTPMEPVVRHA